MEPIFCQLINLWRTDRYTFLFFSALFGLVLWIMAYQLNLTAESSAAWVQAIGSVTALLLAIYVPYKQRKDELADQREQQQKNERALGIACRPDMQSLIQTLEAKISEIETGDLFFTHDVFMKLQFDGYAEINAVRSDWSRFRVAPQEFQRLAFRLREHEISHGQENCVWSTGQRTSVDCSTEFKSSNLKRLTTLLTDAKQALTYFNSLLPQT